MRAGIDPQAAERGPARTRAFVGALRRLGRALGADARAVRAAGWLERRKGAWPRLGLVAAATLVVIGTTRRAHAQPEAAVHAPDAGALEVTDATTWVGAVDTLDSTTRSDSITRPDAAAAQDAGALEVTDAATWVGAVDTLDSTTGQDSPADEEPSESLDDVQDAAAAAGESPPEMAPRPLVEPGSGVAPIVETGEQRQRPEVRSIPTEDRPETVIKVILGLLTFMALAYLGGHQRVLDWEKRLGISQVITAGLPFILLGMVARLPSVGILTNPVLIELSPVLRIGLGSIGFVAGFRFEAKLFQGLPKGTSTVALLSTLIPSATVAAATAPLLLVFSNATWSDSLHNPVFLRDALILATAGAMTARSSVHLLDTAGSEGVPARILRIEELAGVIGLAFVAAFFRQHGLEGGWHLPGTVWLLVTLGLGTALGLLFYTMLLTTQRRPDFLAVTLGSVAFAAGAAGYLYLSSIAVAFVAGVILANFPGTYQPRLREILKRIERPIYLLALLVIGALWNVSDWRGWVLMPVFMASRLVGKSLAAIIAARRDYLPITTGESRALAISPIGALAIAIVVNAELLYPGGSIELVVSAVIGGGVLTEVFVQLATRWLLRRKRSMHGAPNGIGAADSGDVLSPERTSR